MCESLSPRIPTPQHLVRQCASQHEHAAHFLCPLALALVRARSLPFSQPLFGHSLTHSLARSLSLPPCCADGTGWDWVPVVASCHVRVTPMLREAGWPKL